MPRDTRELVSGHQNGQTGIRLRTLGKEIQKFVEAENFSVVREYCGHGIGEGFHEEPQVLHYDADDGGVVLQPVWRSPLNPWSMLGITAFAP